MFAALNIDRGNISNATSDNMLDDLGLSQADFVSYYLKPFIPDAIRVIDSS